MHKLTIYFSRSYPLLGITQKGAYVTYFFYMFNELKWEDEVIALLILSELLLLFFLYYYKTTMK
jgi:hypothetical protein